MSKKSSYFKVHLTIHSPLLSISRLKAKKNFHNLDDTIKIYNDFRYKFGSDIKFLNFNHYDNRRLTIRLQTNRGDILTESIIRLVCINLKEQRYIDKYVIEKKRDIPDFLKYAHQLATDLAISILESATLRYRFIEKKDIKFMIYFLNKLFKHWGFEVFLWDETRYSFRWSTKDITDVIIKSIDSKEYSKFKSNPDFLERVIHLLFNCLLLQNNIKTNLYGKITTEGLFWLTLNRASALKFIVRKKEDE